MGRTVAKWEKDRWRLMKEDPQWSGTAQRVPVSFTNGDTEMMVLDWSPFTDEQIEAERRLQEELKIDMIKRRVKDAVKSAEQPVFIHTNTRARIPAGYVPLRLSEFCAKQQIPDMIDYIKEVFDFELVFTPKGVEVGINVVATRIP
jgi:hypothetical protein